MIKCKKSLFLHLFPFMWQEVRLMIRWPDMTCCLLKYLSPSCLRIILYQLLLTSFGPKYDPKHSKTEFYTEGFCING